MDALVPLAAKFHRAAADARAAILTAAEAAAETVSGAWGSRRRAGAAGTRSAGPGGLHPTQSAARRWEEPWARHCACIAPIPSRVALSRCRGAAGHLASGSAGQGAGPQTGLLAQAEAGSSLRFTAPAAADDKDNAALYLRFMKKALEKGEAYLEGELARLNKMAEKAMSGERAMLCVQRGHAARGTRPRHASQGAGSAAGRVARGRGQHPAGGGALEAAASDSCALPLPCTVPLQSRYARCSCCQTCAAGTRFGRLLGQLTACRLASSASFPGCSPLSAAAKLDEVSRKVSVLTSFVEEPPKEAAPATPTEDEDDADEGEEVEEEEAAAEEDDEVYDDGLDDNEGAGGCARGARHASAMVVAAAIQHS